MSLLSPVYVKPSTSRLISLQVRTNSVRMVNWKIPRIQVTVSDSAITTEDGIEITTESGETLVTE